jgi:phage-related protein
VTAEISQWLDVNGTVTTLDVDWDASGRYMAEIVHEEDAVPGQDGARHRAAHYKPHEFTLKLTISANPGDEAGLRTALRNLMVAMDPKRGAGIIRVTSPIGDVREIECYVASGLGIEEKPGSGGVDMQQAAVVFRAYDPFWRDVSDIAASFSIGATPSFFPIFPLRLTASQIAVDTTVTNSGDTDAWPVWTIVGPGSGIVLRNLTTGELLLFNTLSLGTGESVVIDTRPGRKTVTKQDGSNSFPDLDVSSSLWALRTGTTSVRLEMSAALAGVSSLAVNYRQRYLSP